MKRTYTDLNSRGMNIVAHEAEREGLEVRLLRGGIIIEGDEESIRTVSLRLDRNYNNGDGKGILSREEYPNMF